MKNTTAILSFILISFFGNAQVLFTENFENYTLGNLGTDPHGAIPGQGGWFTFSLGNTKANDLFLITNEPNKGKVLTLTVNNIAAPQKEYLHAIKQGLDTLIDKRIIGNNVIKFELDYYTGEQQMASSNTPLQRLFLYYGNSIQNFHQNKHLIQIHFSSLSGTSYVNFNNGDDSYSILKLNNSSNTTAVLPYKTWVTFIFYLDYNNRKVYCEMPYFNSVSVGDFLINSSSANLLEDFKPFELKFYFVAHEQNSAIPLTNKYDNIKITALNAVPPHILSAESFLAQKFNLFPNPATNVVTITNGENIFVTEIAVYDVAGKLIKTENYNSKTEIQLNIENLASGTYLLHLKTNEGTAVKKLVKK